MDLEQLQKDAAKEKKRLLSILKKVNAPKTQQDLLIPVIENLAWMRAKLDDAREQIKTSSIAIAYDNGGGQTGIRENPLFKGYEALWKAYLSGLEKVQAALPATMAAEPIAPKEDAPKNVLELIRDRHKTS